MPQDPCRKVLVCQYRSCLAQGSAQTLQAFIDANVPDLEVEACDCQGQCSSGPTVRVLPEETWYCRVRASDVSNIVERHLCGGEPVAEKLNPRIHMRIY
jgi:(2Fe-2S) ferredoxin